MRLRLAIAIAAFVCGAAIAQTPPVPIGPEGPNTGAAAPPSGSGTVGNCNTVNGVAYYAVAGTTITCSTGVTVTNTSLNLSSAVTFVLPDNSVWTSTNLALRPAGTTTNPTLVFTNCGSNCGFLAPAANQFELVVGGVNELDYGITNSTRITLAPAVQLNSNLFFLQNAATLGLRNGNTLLTSPASASLQLGNVDAASPVAQTLGVQNVVAGTSNTAGQNFTINMSRGTGTGAGGGLAFQYAAAGSTGSSQNALASVGDYGITGVNWTFKNGLTLASGQLNVTSMTQTAVAQSGSVCYNSSTGAVTYDSSTTCLLSSMTVKHDWRPLEGALPEVMQLNPVDFLYDDQGAMPGRQIGLLAEQVAKVDPRLVTNDDGRPMGVRYINAIALAFAAIKEQQAEIEVLKAQVEHSR
jgi:endosialidase-like protein